MAKRAGMDIVDPIDGISTTFLTDGGMEEGRRAREREVAAGANPHVLRSIRATLKDEPRLVALRKVHEDRASRLQAAIKGGASVGREQGGRSSTTDGGRGEGKHSRAVSGWRPRPSSAPSSRPASARDNPSGSSPAVAAEQRREAELTGRVNRTARQPASYFANLAFQPGVQSLLWLAAVKSTRRRGGVPRLRGVNIPDTVVIRGAEPVWLRTNTTTGVVERASTSDAKWTMRFRQLCAGRVGAPQPVSLTSSAVNPSTGDPADNCVALARTPDWREPRANTTVALNDAELLSRLNTGESDFLAIQSFIRCKGPRPTVYRLLWRRGKSCSGYSVVAKPRAGAQTAKEVTSSGYGSPPRSHVRRGMATSASAPGLGAQKPSHEGHGHGALSQTTLKPVAEEPLSPRGSSAAKREHADLTHQNCISTQWTGAYEAIKVSGRAVAGADSACGAVADYLQKILQPAAAWVFDELLCDFIKDDDDTWWLLQVKSYKLTAASYSRVRASVSSAPSSPQRRNELDMDDEDGPSGDVGEVGPGVLLSRPNMGRMCHYCRVRYTRAEMIAIPIFRGRRGASGSKRDGFDPEAEVYATAGAPPPGATSTVHKMVRSASAGHALRHKASSAALRGDGTGAAGSHRRRGAWARPDHDHDGNPAVKDVKVPVFGSTMTLRMMKDTVAQLKLRGLNVDAYAHMQHQAETATQARYQSFAVCRLCYEVYTSQLRLAGVAREWAATLGVPVDATRIEAPTKHLESTQTEPAALALGTGGAAVKRNRRLAHPNLARVPVAEMPGDVRQYRFLVVFRQLQDAPAKADVPSKLTRGVQLRYRMLEHEHKIPIALNGRQGTSALVPINHVRIHYILATPAGLVEMLADKTVAVKLVVARKRRVHPAQTMELEEDEEDVENLATAGMHLRPFAAAGKNLSQVKHDMMLSLNTQDVGLVTVAASIGIVCDGPVLLAQSDVLTAGGEVFWPDESHHDALPLPQGWMGTISGGSGVAAAVQVDDEKKQIETEQRERRLAADREAAEKAARDARAAVGAASSDDGWTSSDTEVDVFEDVTGERPPIAGTAGRPTLLSPATITNDEGGPWQRQLQRVFSDLAVAAGSAPQYPEAVANTFAAQLRADEAALVAEAGLRSSAKGSGATLQPIDETKAKSGGAGAPKRRAHGVGRVFGRAYRSYWQIVTAHIRGGSFKMNGRARGGTAGRPVFGSSRAFREAALRLTSGTEWMRAARTLAKSAPTKSEARIDVRRTPSLRHLPAGGTMARGNVALTWRDLLKVFRRSEALPQPQHQESLARRARREVVLRYMFSCVDSDSRGVVDAAELRSWLQTQVEVAESRAATKTEGLLDDEEDIVRLSRHYALWILRDEDVVKRFKDYDINASGAITWPDFLKLAYGAYARITAPGSGPLAVPTYGNCQRHGETMVNGGDLHCIQCEKLSLTKEQQSLPEEERKELKEHSNIYATNAGRDLLVSRIGKAEIEEENWIQAWAEVRKHKGKSPRRARRKASERRKDSRPRSRSRRRRRSRKAQAQQAAVNRLASGEASGSSRVRRAMHVVAATRGLGRSKKPSRSPTTSRRSRSPARSRGRRGSRSDVSDSDTRASPERGGDRRRRSATRSTATPTHDAEDAYPSSSPSPKRDSRHTRTGFVGDDGRGAAGVMINERRRAEPEDSARVPQSRAVTAKAAMDEELEEERRIDALLARMDDFHAMDDRELAGTVADMKAEMEAFVPR